jgi:4-azaleucine resistance transporter AzlC
MSIEHLANPAHTKSGRFFNGVKDVIPLIIGAFPLGVIYGALAMKAGLSAAASQSMSAFMFAGSAQFLTAQMAAASVPAVVMILAVAVVNLRHALYSASIASYIQNLSPAWKSVLAFLLTDEAFVVVITNFEKGKEIPNKRWYFLGAGLGMWIFWQAATAIGIFLGEIIPPTWPLDFALPLSFIAMVVPALKDRASTGAAIAAGIVAVLAFALPYKLSIILAAFVGIFVGVLLEKKS